MEFSTLHSAYSLLKARYHVAKKGGLTPYIHNKKTMKKISKKESKKPEVKEIKKEEIVEKVEELKTQTHEEVLINKRNPRAGIVG